MSDEILDRNIDLKMSQYEMLSKTLNDIVENDRDTDSVDDILQGMKETIKEIYDMRKGNVAYNRIPKRIFKRKRRSSVGDIKVACKGKFSVDGENVFGISDDIVDGVWEDTIVEDGVSRNRVSFIVKDACVDFGNGYVPIVYLLEKFKEFKEVGDITLVAYDQEGNELYRKTYKDCEVSVVCSDAIFSRNIEGERTFSVIFEYKDHEYSYE